MASFMTTRLSSARCEGGPGNLPLPKVKNGGGFGKVLHLFGNTLVGVSRCWAFGRNAPLDCFCVSPKATTGDALEDRGATHRPLKGWGQLPERRGTNHAILPVIKYP